MKYKKLIESCKLLFVSLEDYNNFYSELIGNTRLLRQRKLLDYLWFCDHNFDDEQLEDEKISKAILDTDELLHESTLATLAYELNRKIQRFLVQQELEEDELLHAQILARVYKKRGNAKRFLNTSTQKLEKVMPDEEMDYHFTKAMQNHDAYFHPGATFHHEKEYRYYPRDARYHMLVASTIFHLKTCIEDLVRAKIYNEDLAEDFHDQLSSFLIFLPPNIKEILLVKLLLKSVTLLSKPTIEAYQALKMDFLTNIDVLKSEKKTILLHLMNGLTLIPFPNGRIPEHFELIKIGVKHDLFVEYGCFSAQLFINFVYVASTMKAKDWVTSFIDKNEKHLRYETKSLKNIKHIIYGYKFFVLEDFRAVRKEIAGINTRDVYFSTRKYILDIKAIYELLDEEGLSTLKNRCSNFQTFIRVKLKSDHFDEPHANKHYNFIDLTLKIAKQKYSSLSKEMLQKELEQTKGEIIEKSWLSDKIQRLR